MARISCLPLVLVCLAACKTSSDPQTLAAAKAPELVRAEPAATLRDTTDAPLTSCQNLKADCPGEERKLPYQCVAYRLAGKLLWQEQRVYAWGASLCQARHSLLMEACGRKLDPAALGDIHCSPDSTEESCPIPRKNCPDQGTPTRCVANRYKNQDIPWSERPIAWAANDCKARETMLAAACQQGLNPKDLGDISCSADPAPGQCPPIAADCEEKAGVPTSCQVSTIGDITLKKPWVTQGASACEAQFRLKQLACRMTDAVKKLTPEQLGSMECRSLMDQPRRE